MLPPIIKQMRKDSLRLVFRGSILRLCFTVLLTFLFVGSLFISNPNPTLPIVLGLATAGCWSIFIVCGAKALNGKYQQNFYKLYSTAPDPEAFSEKISELYSTQPVGSMWLDPEYLIYESGFAIDVIETSRIIWAYTKQVDRYAYGMKLRNDSYCSINLRTLQETKIEIPMSEDFYCERVLKFFQHNLPHIVLGYSDQLLSLYDNRFREFCELSRRNAASRNPQ